MSVAENIKIVQSEIAESAIKAGRNPADITLVAVTKTRTVTEIQEAHSFGLVHFGENRVQEAAAKIPVLPGDIKWHMIGHLQSNKIKEAAGLFSWIDSVDSIEKADLISSRASSEGKIVKVLVQVKVSREETKTGADYKDVEKIIIHCSCKEGIEVCGLMTIGTFGVPENVTRSEFKLMKEIYDSLRDNKETARYINVLSMGMSDDFRIAVEEGSTMLRVGTAIFGRRI